jgi:Kdo2-lipid IVA lauroyltransferase/acyltransferase
VPALKSLKRFLRFLLVRTLVFICSIFPVKWVSRVSSWLGTIGPWIVRSESKKALNSLSIAFPQLHESEKQKLIQNMFSHLGQLVAELVCVRQIDAHIDEWVHFDEQNRKILDDALAQKKGVIFVSAHLGNWELLARRISLLGYPCQTIAREASDRRTTKMIEQMRMSANLKSIWRGSFSAAKDMLKAIKRQEILGLLIDQDTKVQSVFVPFFGRLAKTPKGAADLVLKTGAIPLMGFAVKVAPHRYQIVLQNVPLPSAESVDASLELTSVMTKMIEEKVREFPGQYMWIHERWKSVPT